MTNEESNEAIKQWLLDNYEGIIKEAEVIIKQKVDLLVDYPHLTREIKDQFRWGVCSLIIQMIADARPDIPAEDVQVYIRSLDIDNFLTLDIHAKR